MAELLTTQQKTYLRADGHRSEFFMSVSEAPTLLTATINDGAIVQGATVITVNAGTGDISLIRDGMLVELDTSFGTTEIIRLVGASLSGSSPTISGTLTVDVNGLHWYNGGTVRVIGTYDILAIQPYFDPLLGLGTATKRGQLVSDNTSKPPPVADPGPNQVAFLTGASVVFNLNGNAEAMADGASITTWLWEATGGVIASAASQNTTLTVSSTGQIWVSLTVTDSNGKSHRSNRKFWVHSPDELDADYPYVNFQAGSIPMDRGGGNSVSVSVHGVADFSAFRDGALVVIWQKSFYGTETDISFISDAENILFKGYILKDSLSQDYQLGTVSFDIGDEFEVLKQVYLPALYLQAVAAPVYWFQFMAKMTLDRMLHWLIYWHSSLLECCSVKWSNLTTYKKLYKWGQGTLDGQIRGICERFRCLAGRDKAGNIWIEQNADLLDATGRNALSNYLDMTSADWREEIQIRRRHRGETVFSRVVGYLYDGVNVETITPFEAIAPSKVKTALGRGESSMDGVVVVSQNDANMLAGRLMALDNNDITEVVIKFRGNYSFLDAFPQRWITWTLAAADNARGLSFTNLRLMPETVNMSLDFENGVVLVDAVLRPEVPSADGLAVVYPGAPQCPTSIAGGVEPRHGDDLADEANVDQPPTALVVFTSTSVYKRILPDEDDWTQLVSGETGILHGKIDPWWHIRNRSYNPVFLEYVYGGPGLLKRATGLDTTPASDLPTAPPNTWSDGTPPTNSNTHYMCFGFDAMADGEYYVLVRYQTGGLWRGWLLKRTTLSDSYLPLYDGVTLPTEVKPLWMAVTGKHILVTTWRDLSATTTMRLLIFDKSPFAYNTEYSLGDATEAQIDSSARLAFPVATPDYSASAPDNDAPFVVAGRMNDPVSLSGLKFMLQYNGSAWNEISILDENGAAESMGSDWLASALAGPKDNSGREYWALREAAP